MRSIISHLIQYLLIFYVFTFIVTGDVISKNKINYRDEMRALVMLISSRAKQSNHGFVIVPQNAMELITDNGKPEGKLIRPYLDAIDGTGCEELFYGHGGDGKRNSKDTTSYFLNYLLLFKQEKKSVLIIDYVINRNQALTSYRLCEKNGFISFQANRALTKIPAWSFNLDNDEVKTLSEADNFLYLLDASRYKTRESYLNAIKKLNYDLIVIDAFFWEKILSCDEVKAIQRKPSGKRRLVISYLSIGEAETYRYYWRREWKKKPPVFLEKENPEWKGNYKVKYRAEEWKEIICGRTDGSGFENSYLKKILDAGFDGVYLDVLDAAYYFEKNMR